MDAGPHTYCVARRRTQRGQQQRRGWHSGLNPVFRSKSSCAPLDNRPGFLFFVSAHSLQRQPVADKPHRRGARKEPPRRDRRPTLRADGQV